jgi:hypothetical protein
MVFPGVPSKDALDLDGLVGNSSKHAGKLFSVVYKEDLGCVQWAVGKLVSSDAHGWVEKLGRYGQALGVQPVNKGSSLGRTAGGAASEYPCNRPRPPKRDQPLMLPDQNPSKASSSWRRSPVQAHNPFVGAEAPERSPRIPAFARPTALTAGRVRSEFAKELLIQSEVGASLTNCYHSTRAYWVGSCKDAMQKRHEFEFKGLCVELGTHFKVTALEYGQTRARAADYGEQSAYSFDKVVQLDQTRDSAWHKCNGWKVGIFAKDPELSNQSFEFVYNHARVTFLTWVCVESQGSSRTGWMADFSSYIMKRANSEHPSVAADIAEARRRAADANLGNSRLA